MTKEISKPWGSELILEHNDKYVVKKLFVKAGHRLSLQYHEKKHETMYILEGEIELTLGDLANQLETKKMSINDFVILPPGKIHRVKANLDSWILEASTPELTDVVRLQDDYNR